MWKPGDKKIRVALLAGGKSGEREVSLAGAAGFEAAIDKNKYQVVRYDTRSDLGRLLEDAKSLDVVFILLHGTHGEDGTVQGFLELLGLPYQGAGVLGSALAIDKNVAKQMYSRHGLPVAGWLMAEAEDLDNPSRLIDNLGLPLVVKPVREGSSLGMSIAASAEELTAGLRLAFEHDAEVMVEKFITGREITVGVIGNEELQSLPLVEIIPGREFKFFDYRAKYEKDASEEICPADVSPRVTEAAQRYAVAAHRALQLRGYSRTDMILTADEELYLLETNTIPGMTPTSLLPRAAAAAGLDFTALIDRLLTLALEYQASRKQRM